MRYFVHAAIAGLLLALPIEASSAPVQIFASPGGSASPDGTRAHPYTLAQTRTALQQLASGVSADIVLLPGTYQVQQTYLIDASIWPASMGTLRFFPDGFAYGTVLISGGELVTGWTDQGPAPQNSSLHLWSTCTKAASRDLYLNNVRMRRARTPNFGGTGFGTGFATISCTDANRVSYDLAVRTPNTPGSTSWATSDELEAVAPSDWVEYRQRVSSAFTDPSGATSTHLAFPTGHPLGYPPTIPIGTPLYPLNAGTGCASNPGSYNYNAYLENSFCFLDQDGEFFFQKNPATDPTGNHPCLGSYYLCTGYPYQLFMALTLGTNPNTKTVVMPRLDTLFRVQAVSHVQFLNLFMGFTEYTLPDIYYPWVATYYAGNLPTDPPDLRPAITAAVEFLGGSDCYLYQCRVAHTGGSGLRSAQPYNGLVNQVAITKFNDIGASAVLVGNIPTAGGGAYTVPGTHWITQNLIADFGVRYTGAPGIALFRSNGANIGNNEIHGGGYSGIVAGSTACDPITSTPPVNLSGVIIQNNNVYEVMRVLHDGAGIYTNGPSVLSAMDSNWVHDIHGDLPPPNQPCAGNRAGMYWDIGSFGWTVTSNVIDNVDLPYHFNPLSLTTSQGASGCGFNCTDPITPNTCSAFPCKLCWNASHPNYFCGQVSGGCYEPMLFATTVTSNTDPAAQAIRDAAGPSAANLVLMKQYYSLVDPF